MKLTKPRRALIAVVFSEYWGFCAVLFSNRAAKLSLSWLILPKSPGILLIADLSVLLGVLSWYPVAFRGMLDDIIDLMVLFIV